MDVRLVEFARSQNKTEEQIITEALAALLSATQFSEESIRTDGGKKAVEYLIQKGWGRREWRGGEMWGPSVFRLISEVIGCSDLAVRGWYIGKHCPQKWHAYRLATLCNSNIIPPVNEWADMRRARVELNKAANPD